MPTDMVGRFVMRVVDLVVVLLALLAFFTVPVGTRTPYQHVRAILGTEEAASTGRDIVDTTKRLAGGVRGVVAAMPSSLGGSLPGVSPGSLAGISPGLPTGSSPGAKAAPAFGGAHAPAHAATTPSAAPASTR